MNNECPQCGAPTKVVPAGISKRTNKPYKAFIACTERNCNYTARLDNQSSTNASYSPKFERTEPPVTKKELDNYLNAIRVAFKELQKDIDGLKGALIDESNEKAFQLHRESTGAIREQLTKVEPEEEIPVIPY